MVSIVEEIALHDLGSLLLERRRSIVLAMHHGADFEPTSDRFPGGGAAGVSGGPRDQDRASHERASFTS